MELCLGGEWTSVCADGLWDNDDAKVVCRQLGYQDVQSELKPSHSASNYTDLSVFLLIFYWKY